MVRTFGVCASAFAILILLTGCWNRMELDNFAFVQATAIDLADDDESIALTIQYYKPVSGTSQGGGPPSQSFINVKTEDDTVFEAVRDMTIHFGRKAQFSHMRVLIIGERLARKRHVGEVLDLFSRDHEPRATVFIMIGKGKAAQYLEKTEPFIESTIGQQIRESERMAYLFSGKSVKTTFLDLMLQLKGQTGVATIPYVYFDPKNKPKTSPVTALGVMKEGKLVTTVSAKKIESLLMVLNQYKSGVIEVVCPGQKNKKIKKMDAAEVAEVNTQMAVKIKGESVAVHVTTKIDGYVGELACTTIKTPEDMEKFNERVKKTVERDLKNTVAFFQKKKLDVFGIGNNVYRQNPALWKRLKRDWDERFAEIPFTYKIEVNIFNTGANLGVPVSK
ncbi:Ger(x)C family spore germination protein [Paenibacillus alkalitolerans]|uniref:Ger(x)C family spore germination protein n=1 Tax=Paenibacillus alkalitolerans TaxID=2799335 RepID=UPI0018F284F5|nr:Ger(x)C family spore germination protein [Paenibacillus alkalitolerans]